MRTVAAEIPKDSPLRAMSRVTGLTQLALAASGVNLAHYALAQEWPWPSSMTPTNS